MIQFKLELRIKAVLSWETTQFLIENIGNQKVKNVWKLFVQVILTLNAEGKSRCGTT